MASAGHGRLAEHVNVGYTLASSNLPGLGISGAPTTSVPDELGFVGGVEFVATPRVTLLADVLSRSLRDVGRLSPAEKTFSFQDASGPVTPPRTATFSELEPRAGNLNLVLGAVGVKANVWGDLLVSANVLFPLTDAGLRSRISASFGVDFAF